MTKKITLKKPEPVEIPDFLLAFGKTVEEILEKKKDLELKIHEAQRRLRGIKNKKRERIEYLGVRLRNFCTLPGPIVTLIIAIVLGIRRAVMRRHHISHASDA